MGSKARHTNPAMSPADPKNTRCYQAALSGSETRCTAACEGELCHTFICEGSCLLGILSSLRAMPTFYLLHTLLECHFFVPEGPGK